MRAFYLGWPISQAASAKTLRSPTVERKSHISQTVSAKLTGVPSRPVHSRFPLPWSHYARLLAVRNAQARAMKAKRFAAAGPFGNSIVRFSRNSTNVRPLRATRPPCSARELDRTRAWAPQNCGLARKPLPRSPAYRMCYEAIARRSCVDDADRSPRPRDIHGRGQPGEAPADYDCVRSHQA
jgi:hypothetical protein